MFTRTKTAAVPEVGAEAPEFNLPSAQGGQLRLSMRTVRGPVVVAFYRQGDEEDVEYFEALAAKEEEINLAAGSVVAIGVAEPAGARNFARASGLKSYVLYDYAKVASRQWGLLEKDKKEGEYARRAVFIVGPDHNVAHAWIGERPEPEDILAKISEISGLPKPPEEPKEDEKEASEEPEEKPKKMSAEKREKIKAERRAARESGESVKEPESPEAGSGTTEEEAKKEG
jgi:peroxiredoxin